MDSELLDNMSALAPDLMHGISKRALVLERIATLAPIGRRALAARLNMPEREVRAISTALKEAGHITLNASGMELTPDGYQLVDTARAISDGVRAIALQEAFLSRLLGVARVVIVKGDADKDRSVLNDVGRAAAMQLRTIIREGTVLTVTGGMTMARVVQRLTPAAPLDILVLPARGGMGRAVETQAGTLAAQIARMLGGHHRLLHVPDQLSDEAREEMLKVPEIGEVVELLKKTEVLLHGVGSASRIAIYRHMDKTALEQLDENGAVAEAFGYYFDIDGKPVGAAGGLGIEPDTLAHVRSMAAVAAGESKACAIIAVMRAYRHELLVTDEGAARQMIAQLTTSNNA